MKKEQKELLRLQRIDPLHVAEELTGEDYKISKATESLGFLLHIQKGQEMRERLAALGDTQFSNTVKDYLRIACGFGFEVVYTEPFMREGIEECLYVLFHEEFGIILHFDSYTWGKDSEPSVNSGKFHYNWSPNTLYSNLTSSGHYYRPKGDKHLALYEKDLLTQYYIPNYPDDIKWDYNTMSHESFQALSQPIEQEQQALFDLAVKCGKRFLWIGDHDCREALITTIKAMYENGKFFPIWHDCQFNWITNYQEHKGSDMKYPFTDYYEATKKRIALMPEKVRRCINNTYRP